MKRRRDESGFAMLLVFLMAASIAIMMYMELPRAAFEAQRAKEEMLQERGEQYIRAIQLYVAKWKSYPPSIDVLEKTNNVRYLRKRYKDPMTGKDEWRVIHVNSAGQLTDSIIKKKEGEEKKANLNTFIGEMPTVGGATPNAADTGQNVALRRRASDQPGAPGTSGGGGAVPPVDPQSLGNGAQAGQAPGTQYPVPGVAQVPGQPGQPGVAESIRAAATQPESLSTAASRTHTVNSHRTRTRNSRIRTNNSHRTLTNSNSNNPIRTNSSSRRIRTRSSRIKIRSNKARINNKTHTDNNSRRTTKRPSRGSPWGISPDNSNLGSPSRATTNGTTPAVQLRDAVSCSDASWDARGCLGSFNVRRAFSRAPRTRGST